MALTPRLFSTAWTPDIEPKAPIITLAMRAMWIAYMTGDADHGKPPPRPAPIPCHPCADLHGGYSPNTTRRGPT